MAFKVQMLTPAAMGRALIIERGFVMYFQVGHLCQLEVPMTKLSSLVANMLHGATELFMYS